jgi:alkanesulfonate monooxygenase SsuD/methylene tetrahydromethanopterin reductase-like flavin-dependent oxidoreductase (luciferase family)
MRRVGRAPGVRMALEGGSVPVTIMNFDLRHPREFSPTGAEIYAAALDMCAWADEHGFRRVGIPEHHQNEDGYISCPLLFAAAIGGCTKRIKVRTGIVIAPLYEPLRLAEEVAVADLCLRGRLELGMGLGVLRADYEAFGVDFSRRGAMLEELIPFLRRAWTGEPFAYRGTTVRVMPRPVQEPMPIYLGGMTKAAAERAARLADGFHTMMSRNWELYRDACLALGKPDPGPHTPRGPLFLWVTKHDKSQVLEQLRVHFAQQIESYEEQNRKAGGGLVNPWEMSADRPPYAIVNPEEAIELANSLGATGELIFQPLLSAIEPAKAWEMLRVLEREVLPHLDH